MGPDGLAALEASRDLQITQLSVQIIPTISGSNQLWVGEQCVNEIGTLYSYASSQDI